MPDTALENLTATTALAESDLLYAVRDPAGTPASRKMTLTNFRKAFLAGVVDVASYATGGAGTSGSPWTGWDTAITWTANTEYLFRSGYFSYATSPNFLLTGIVLRGEAGTILKHTGTGNAFVMDATTTPGVHIQKPRVENITVLGNANTTNGFFLRGVLGGQFNNLRLTGGCTNACLWSEACVLNELNSFWAADDVWTTAPPYGVVFTDRGDTGSGEQTTTWSVNNLGIARTTNTCLYLKNTFYNTIVNSAPGFSPGKGVVVAAASTFNTFIQVDCESNLGQDWVVDGANNVLITCFGTSDVVNNAHFNNVRTTIMGGIFTNANFVAANEATVLGTVFSGTFTNSSAFATFTNCYNSTAGVYIVGVRQQAGAKCFDRSFHTGSYTPDVNLYEQHDVTHMQGNITIANPTVTPRNGQIVVFHFSQSNTGIAATVTWGTAFRGPGGTIPANTLTDTKDDWYTFRYNATDAKYDLVSTSLNI